MGFKEEIIEQIAKTGLKKSLVEELLEVPPERKMGDFALPCFKLAKEMKKSPGEIATEISQRIKLPKPFSKKEVKGPYLNFFIDESEYTKTTIEEILKKKEKYGLKEKKGNKIIVEYCQANPMKAFHIGHVRNICMGESIARLFEASGKNVIRMNYGGDVGPHVSKTIYAYQKLQAGQIPKDTKEQGKWLGELYAKGAKEVEDNPNLEEKMREMVVELEQGNKKLAEDWQKLRKMSLNYFDLIYRDLGINFDRIILESEVEKEGIVIAKKLFKEGIAEKDEGALLVDLTEYKLDKFLVLKSDGAALYSSKDLALAKLKKKELKAEESFNVVGSEQRFYFQQLIKTIELLNKHKNEYCKTTHIPYELVKLEGGKMASRKGKVITFQELFDKIYEKTFSETQNRHSDWTKEKISNKAKLLALTAIKFGMLAQDKNKPIIFNWERATSLEGETGAFVQYSYARATSILKKTGKTEKPKQFAVEHEKEKELVSMLAAYKNKVAEASETLSPHKIAYYLLDLASLFNSFYHEVKVLKSEGNLRTTRIALVKATAMVIENGLNILNIEKIEEM